jgi:oxygen-dependent protoporphyrinogen oxidase
MQKIIILGAGISGLALAWFLRKQPGLKITILEKRARVGGWIETVEADGFLFEQGPRGLRPEADTLQLIQELGLQDQILVNDPAAKVRYLYRQGRLTPLPTSVWGLAASPWLLKLLSKPLWREWRIPKMAQDDESVYEFFCRRFSRQVAEELVDPMALGIYAGDIRQLSLRSCFPSIYNLEQKHGSLLRAALAGKRPVATDPFVAHVQRSSLFTLRGGMETLVKELARQMDDLEIRNDCTVDRLDLNRGEVYTSQGVFAADQILSTLPAHQLYSLYPDPMLATIPTQSLVVVNLGYRASVLKKAGFGYLVPSKERESILGVVWDSCLFPEQNRSSHETRLTAMVAEQGLSDPQIEQLVLKAMANHLGIRQPPDLIKINRKSRAIAQYSVGHAIRVQEFRRRLPTNLKVFGSSFDGVAVNTCISQAKQIYL